MNGGSQNTEVRIKDIILKMTQERDSAFARGERPGYGAISLARLLRLPKMKTPLSNSASPSNIGSKGVTSVFLLLGKVYLERRVWRQGEAVNMPRKERIVTDLKTFESEFWWAFDIGWKLPSSDARKTRVLIIGQAQVLDLEKLSSDLRIVPSLASRLQLSWLDSRATKTLVLRLLWNIIPTTTPAGRRAVSTAVFQRLHTTTLNERCCDQLAHDLGYYHISLQPCGFFLCLPLLGKWRGLVRNRPPERVDLLEIRIQRHVAQQPTRVPPCMSSLARLRAIIGQAMRETKDGVKTVLFKVSNKGELIAAVMVSVTVGLLLNPFSVLDACFEVCLTRSGTLQWLANVSFV
ncbi:hypothetical protein F5141DRAFT_1067379 [Pisolithus sp. B1]|nr:hypothetical protein F5141DRAFT_1067379 [Pisolithus sp. B1]